MFLSQSSEYALRVVAFLAVVYGEKKLSAPQIAAEIDVPVPYLSKILRKLVVAGILDGVRGKGGGFSLARTPSAICFLEVLQAIDLDLEGKHCVFGQKKCNSQNPCLLHFQWDAFNTSFLTWASTTYFSDVLHDVDRKSPLSRYRKMMKDICSH